MTNFYPIPDPVRLAPQGPVPAVHSRRRRRYAVWDEQQRIGHETCFATMRRLLCEQHGCPWRAECLSLRAEWMR